MRVWHIRGGVSTERPHSRCVRAQDFKLPEESETAPQQTERNQNRIARVQPEALLRPATPQHALPGIKLPDKLLFDFVLLGHVRLS